MTGLRHGGCAASAVREQPSPVKGPAAATGRLKDERWQPLRGGAGQAAAYRELRGPAGGAR